MKKTGLHRGNHGVVTAIYFQKILLNQQLKANKKLKIEIEKNVLLFL